LSGKVDILENYWTKAGLLIALFIASYWIPLSGIVNTWINDGDYSYGFLIPVISAYLFWEKRDELRNINIRSSWVVLPVLILAVILSIYGILGSSGNISRPLIPVLIILFTAFCFGIGLTWKMILPLGFLVFMVPLPAVLDRTIGVFLKSISSKLGGEMLRLLGHSVHIRGNVIDLGITQLQVVDACSGLRFLFPLIALGIVYAFFFENVAWKRVVCVLATIPIAIITNVLRIGITGQLVYSYGSEMAEGFFHGFSGWAVFMVAFVMLFILGRILRLFPPKAKSEPPDAAGSNRQENHIEPVRKSGKAAFVTSIALLVIVGGLSMSTEAMPPLKINGGIEGFPLTFENWEGRQESIDPEITEESGAEGAFSASYHSTAGESVSLYMGYRSSAFMENENFFHSPTVCLPSSGWKTIEKSRYTVADVPKFGKLTVTRMIMKSMGNRMLVYFWFQTKDQASYDKNIHRYHLARHAIKRDNTHALFIRPITMVQKNESLQDAEKRMDGFVRDMMAALFSFLADNQVEGGSG
jgi:exosortase D (VPLPA-CTERM-specific)